MKKLICTIHGESTEDRVIGMEEVLRLVREGFLSGFDDNDTGNFEFTIGETDGI